MNVIEVAETADRMFENKYGERFEALKKHFIAFYNLCDQISTLYVAILDSSNQL